MAAAARHSSCRPPRCLPATCASFPVAAAASAPHSVVPEEEEQKEDEEQEQEETSAQADMQIAGGGSANDDESDGDSEMVEAGAVAESVAHTPARGWRSQKRRAEDDGVARPSDTPQRKPRTLKRPCHALGGLTQTREERAALRSYWACRRRATNRPSFATSVRSRLSRALT